MLTMYIKTGCGFCAMAIDKARELNLDVEYKNIADEGVIEELVEKGGKRQVPFIVDSDSGACLYESTEIVNYLNKKYGAGDKTIPCIVDRSCVCSLK